ncbi:ComEA family DNA-binding protein [Curtobacterium sp. MCPF17_052]|uniref:ComEA family DNA-binding protein n=1 Tax=Curtobacterium sp. MCPF17_052 TaxID=2175655 RepID=UPI0024E01C5F|nr:ComEA family DNA-binding protein [Curtobacterium sp. MCPF17_052]WIB12430.1 ComEA family DNA-binding protein [Curtobacterium sp. MCPF17_052]
MVAGGEESGSGVAVVSGAPTVGVPEPSAAVPVPSATAAPTASAVPATAVLYVVGAVEHPGGSSRWAPTPVSRTRWSQPGGAVADADLSRLNLARPVVDGERLYVPRVGETDVPAELPAGAGAGPGGSASGTTGSSGAGSGAGAVPDVVDLNTADAAALETLPGIGPALAERILSWRDEHGGFRSVEDLLEVSGIGEGRFAELQDRVRV